MQKSEIKALILSHQSILQNSSDLIPRISFSWQEGNGIAFISGPLHAGKTSLLRQIAGSLLDIKIYIDFEDSRLQELGSESFEVIEEIAAEIYENQSESNNSVKIYYFLDEVCNIPGWDIWADRLNRQGAEIIVTSSSGLTEQESSSRFAGKINILKLFPFSFKEYLLMKGSHIPRPNFLTPSRSDEMLCMFLQYFENGGFPDVIKTGNISLCQKYFEEILQKGVTAGNDIQDLNALKKLAIFLISNMGCEYSLDTLKKVSRIENEETICRCMDYLEDSFLLYRVPKFDYPPESEEKIDTNCKVYSGDTGFFKAVYPNYPDSLGLRFENLVFLELLRQGKQIFYFHNRGECDFLIKEKDSQEVSGAIQASVHFGSPAVRERELRGLIEAMEEHELEEGTILTLDDEEILRIEGKDEMKKILVKPVWRWMLE